KYLFAYLAFYREKAIHEDRLLDLFWPDCPPNRARKNLSNALYHLRQALGPEESAQWIVREKSLYRTSFPPASMLDTYHFTARHAEARRLHGEGDTAGALIAAREAKRIFAGHFLEENLDDDWVLEPRQRFLDMFLEVLLILAESFLKTGDHPQAAQHARKALDENSTHERAHALLIESLWRNGKRDEAVKHYHRCTSIFKEELGLSPPPDVVALYLRLTSGTV
ncbi:MAG: tetratricopeptide repeat protein, partial [Armatimonadetes bacterium]|nr:tetratricopeptide repeat protein [Armatimonadota bacterium]